MIDDNPEPMGGEGEAIQADETYFGRIETPRTETTSGRPFTRSGKSGPSNKRANEFDFRYNTRDLEDAERAAIAHKQAAGKRLTYRRTG